MAATYSWMRISNPTKCFYSNLTLIRRYQTYNLYRKKRIVPLNVTDGKFFKIMQKMITKQAAKSKRPSVDDRSPSKGYKERLYVIEGTKFKVLNKYYMELITDAMGSGELGAMNETLAFYITKVQMNSDFQYLYVSWSILSTNNIEEIEDIQAHLNAVAPKLRQILCSQHNIGSVPVIRFAQDDSEIKLLKLQKALESADMGGEPIHNLDTSLLTPQAMLPTEENQQSNTGGRPREMRQDIFDLDHTHLMKQVMNCPRKRLNQVHSPMGDYDTQDQRDFDLQLRKQKYKKKEICANEVQTTTKVRVELINQDVIEDVYEEDTWDEEESRDNDSV